VFTHTEKAADTENAFSALPDLSRLTSWVRPRSNLPTTVAMACYRLVRVLLIRVTTLSHWRFSAAG
jgi:hypothetical protein